MYARIRSDALGRLDVTPRAFPSDSSQSFLLTYTAGPAGIEAGGQIRFLTPRVFSTPNTLRSRSGGSGWASGFTEVVERPEGVETSLAIEPPLWGHWVTTDIVLTVTAGRLTPGQRVVVRYGGRTSKVHVAKMAGRVFVFRALIDPDGSRPGPHSGFTFLTHDVPLESLPGDPVRLEAYVPSSPANGVDGGGARPSSVLVVLKDPSHNVLTSRVIESADSECRALASAGGRVARVEVRDRAAGLVGVSNPSVAPAAGEPRLYWGDLHVHTHLSDDASAERTSDDAMDFARESMGHDFVAVTDHVNNVRADEWQGTLDAARRAARPARFVALAGFEFNSREQPSGRRLDRNVYYADFAAASLPPGVSRDDYHAMSTAELARWIDPQRHLLIPHQHNGGLWDDPSVAKMRLVEMYAHWGAFERPGGERPFAMGQYPPGALVGDALDAGLRLGFVGGSDTHSAHPGNDYLWPHGNMPGGLTAVWAPDLSARSLFGALSQRSCYATTRARIWLRFSVNGAPMGSELTLESPTEPRLVHVEAHGTAPLAEVSLIRSGETLCAWHPNDWDFDAEHADDAAPSARGWDYYYVRVKQCDAEMAWSSPIWVSG